jgi:branched-chain amino acid transport system permease protein
VGSFFGDLIVGGLAQGCLYALVGAGLVVLFRSTGVINFAQGSFMVLGGFTFFTLNGELGLNLYLSLAVTLLVCGLVGAAIYLLAFRRLVGAAPFTLVIATFGLAIILQTLVVLVWGPDLRTLPVVLPMAPDLGVAGFAFSVLDVFAVVMSLALIGALELLLRRSRLGTRMRAVADNTLLSGLVKVPVHAMSSLAWGLSAVCAAAAGVAFALRTSLDPIQLQGFGLVAFAAVLLGGLDSIVGALIGGFALALIQNLAVRVLGGDWADAVAYIVLLVVLLARPQGLFGSREVVRL